MAHYVYDEDSGIPMLRVEGDGFVLDFGVMGFPKEKLDWLGSTLERQVAVAVRKNVAEAIAEQQRKLRALAGLS